jgi:hypothetical protein
MWHRVEVVLTDVSEERIPSIFRVEGKIRKSAREASVRDVKRRLLLTSLTDASPADSHIFPSTLKMEAIRSSETSVNTTSTRCHIPEDCFLQFLKVLGDIEDVAGHPPASMCLHGIVLH